MTEISERLRDPNVISMAVRLEAADEIERLRAERDAYNESNERLAAIVSGKNAEIERLRELVKDLADDLEAEVNGHYPPEVRAYPSEQRRYERDMANVYAARRELELKP